MIFLTSVVVPYLLVFFWQWRRQSAALWAKEEINMLQDQKARKNYRRIAELKGQGKKEYSYYGDSFSKELLDFKAAGYSTLWNTYSEFIKYDKYPETGVSPQLRSYVPRGVCVSAAAVTAALWPAHLLLTGGVKAGESFSYAMTQPTGRQRKLRERDSLQERLEELEAELNMGDLTEGLNADTTTLV